MAFRFSAMIAHRPTLVLTVALALSACGVAGQRVIASDVEPGDFGAATMNNTLVMTGQRDATFALQQRFAAEVPSTITFAFNSAALTPAAMAVLDKQARWISQFPELRFRVYGHTDLVGSNGYNQALGKRRAEAVVAYFASRGISRQRLEALVSYGETRPVVQTQNPEQQNRRTVTEVSGFYERRPGELNGKYAAVVYRAYVASGEPVSDLSENRSDNGGPSSAGSDKGAGESGGSGGDQ